MAEAIASYDPAHAGALFAKLAANGTWQCPTLTVQRAMASLEDPELARDPRLQYVSTFLRQRWDPKADACRRHRSPDDHSSARAELAVEIRLVGAMSRAGVPLLAGTDETNPYCFAGFSLHDELAWLVKAGITPLDALRAATSNAARFFGEQGELGAVAEGRVADLVVLDADPRADIANTRKIIAVVARGVLYDRSALDTMLAEVKTAAAAPPSWEGGGFHDD